MKLAEIKNQEENEAVKKAVMGAKPVQWPYYWLGITGKLGNTYIYIQNQSRTHAKSNSLPSSVNIVVTLCSLCYKNVT